MKKIIFVMTLVFIMTIAVCSAATPDNFNVVVKQITLLGANGTADQPLLAEDNSVNVSLTTTNGLQSLSSSQIPLRDGTYTGVKVKFVNRYEMTYNNKQYTFWESDLNNTPCQLGEIVTSPPLPFSSPIEIKQGVTKQFVLYFEVNDILNASDPDNVELNGAIRAVVEVQ